MKHIPPDVSKTAFFCPYCNVLAQQHWHVLGAWLVSDPPQLIRKESDYPGISDPDLPENIRAEGANQLAEYNSNSLTKRPFFSLPNGHWGHQEPISNLWISRCDHCKEMAVWVHDQLVFPVYRSGVQPNPDLSADIRQDVEEARSILSLSPRGAAALLRLAVQKLCKQLGEPGKNIDQDISSLVKKGLNPMLQQALDYVRVVGNNAVHPGEMDLKDDTATAEQLLELVNLIADQMITQPKAIQALYNKLPEEKRKAIENRDKTGKP